MTFLIVRACVATPGGPTGPVDLLVFLKNFAGPRNRARLVVSKRKELIIGRMSLSSLAGVGSNIPFAQLKKGLLNVQMNTLCGLESVSSSPPKKTGGD